MIGKHLGHSQLETTARYAYLARESAQEAPERVAASIEVDVLSLSPKSAESWACLPGKPSPLSVRV